MTTIIRGLRGLLGGEKPVSPPEGTIVDEVTVEVTQPKQPALAASRDTIDKSLAVLNLGSDGKIRDDLKRPLIDGLKDSLANDEKLQEALVKDFGGQANNKREIQIALDIVNLGIPFSVNQLSSSGNSNPSLRKHLSSSPEKKVQPQDLWSKISDQSLKTILKHANRVINTELRKQDGSISEDPNLFKREIDSLEAKINSANKTQAVNSKKLLTLGNTLKLGLVGIAAGTGLELTGVTDFTPLGPNRGSSPMPEQVLSGDAMKMISEFKAVDVNQETQKVIQKRITVNLNLAREKLPSLTLTPTAYYKDTLKPFSINGQQKGVQVQADVKTQINEAGDGKPSAIIYQEGKTSIQITVIPIEAPRALPLKQSTDDITVITIPAGGTPLVKTEKADFNNLLQTP